MAREVRRLSAPAVAPRKAPTVVVSVVQSIPDFPGIPCAALREKTLQPLADFVDADASAGNYDHFLELSEVRRYFLDKPGVTGAGFQRFEPLVGQLQVFGGNFQGVAASTGLTTRTARGFLESQSLVRSMTRAIGSAGADDVSDVVQRLGLLPPSLVRRLSLAGVRINVCRGSVADARDPAIDLTRPPRGQPTADWNRVPGVAVGSTVYLATDRQTHRLPPPGPALLSNTHDLGFHEIGHAVDASRILEGVGSSSAAFMAAYVDDKPNIAALSAADYLLEPGVVGPSEAFAESFAAYFSGAPWAAATMPNMYKYWQAVERQYLL